MTFFLEIEQLKEYIGQLRNASQDPEVREALDGYKGQLSSRTDEQGHKLPIIELALRQPRPAVTIKCHRCSVVMYQEVTIDDFKELLRNLVTVEPTNPTMGETVKKFLAEIPQS